MTDPQQTGESCTSSFSSSSSSSSSSPKSPSTVTAELSLLEELLVAGKSIHREQDVEMTAEDDEDHQLRAEDQTAEGNPQTAPLSKSRISKGNCNGKGNGTVSTPHKPKPTDLATKTTTKTTAAAAAATPRGSSMNGAAKNAALEESGKGVTLGSSSNSNNSNSNNDYDYDDKNGDSSGSPSSNAAAALLVGMGIAMMTQQRRLVHETKIGNNNTNTNTNNNNNYMHNNNNNYMHNNNNNNNNNNKRSNNDNDNNNNNTSSNHGSPGEAFVANPGNPGNAGAAADAMGSSVLDSFRKRQEAKTRATTSASSDVEEQWRKIRLDVSKQTETEAGNGIASGTATGTGTLATSIGQVATHPNDPNDPNAKPLELPKGVTRRPSGAWQAQIYYSGKTRYIGVWETAQQAARAYNLAKNALQELKKKTKPGPRRTSNSGNRNGSNNKNSSNNNNNKNSSNNNKNNNSSSSNSNSNHSQNVHDDAYRKRQRPKAAAIQSKGIPGHNHRSTATTAAATATVTATTLSSLRPPYLTALPKHDGELWLPPSITWPSSASSASSAGSRDEVAEQGPFKKRKVLDASSSSSSSSSSSEQQLQLQLQLQPQPSNRAHLSSSSSAFHPSPWSALSHAVHHLHAALHLQGQKPPPTNEPGQKNFEDNNNNNYNNNNNNKNKNRNNTSATTPVAALARSAEQQQQPQPQPQPQHSLQYHALRHPALQLMSLRPHAHAHVPMSPAFWSAPQRASYPPPFASNGAHPYASYVAAAAAAAASGTEPAKKADRKRPTMVGARPRATGATGAGAAVAKTPAKKAHTATAAGGTDAGAGAGASGRTKTLSSQQIAENETWKSIRAEVVGLFDAARRRRKERERNRLKTLTEPKAETQTQTQTKEGKDDEDEDDPLIRKIFDKDVLRGITVRPSGKFQAQLYFGGRSRYIGVFDSQREAASAYEMIRERIKSHRHKPPLSPPRSLSESSSSFSFESSSSSSSASSGSSLYLKQLISAAASRSETKEGSDHATKPRSITPSPTPHKAMVAAGKMPRR